ncbi:MAG: sulfite exporter TauE/SafE family protein [Pseudomonadota bacterium]
MGAAAGGFINGLAGFGTALFALGFFLTVFPPVEAVALVVVTSVVTGLQGLWVVRRAIWANPRRLARFLGPGLFGVPLGLMLLALVDAETLKIAIALFLLLYGGFFSVRRTLPRIERPTPGIDALVGFLGGVAGGGAAVSGALPTMWCALRAWPKAETRAVLQPYNVAVLGVTAAALALRGAYTGAVLMALVLSLPTALLSAQFGLALFRRLGDAAFRRLLIGLTFLSGAGLLLRTF